MATKAELCIEIYKQLVEAHGEDIKTIRSLFIKRAVEEAACTPAGAATYYANCKNRGGATGETRYKVQRDPNYVSPYANKADAKEEDKRPLYSAIQRDKQGRVGHVAAYFNPHDALTRAQKVRGFAVVGAPEIGQVVSSLKAFDANSMENGFVAHDKMFVIQ